MKLLFILCLFNFLFCIAKEYKAVDELDLTKYDGLWYQIYGDNFNKLFQGNSKCSTAQYKLLDDEVSVLNSQIDKNGDLDQITGYAYYKDGDCCGYLTVLLDGTPEAPYWVLELGPIVEDKYDYSIVSDNAALSLYVLARDVNRFFESYDTQVLESLDDFGFNKKYNNPQIMNQTDC